MKFDAMCIRILDTLAEHRRMTVKELATVMYDQGENDAIHSTLRQRLGTMVKEGVAVKDGPAFGISDACAFHTGDAVLHVATANGTAMVPMGRIAIAKPPQARPYLALEQP